LLTVRELTFEARSRAAIDTGWNGSGEGEVKVEQVEVGVILFHERGTWTPPESRSTKFNNIFRWTANAEGRFIRLEHLRFGIDRPVYLFDLVPVDAGILVSSEPHVCQEDRYAARMEHDEKSIRLQWTIQGPKKAESVFYTYI